MSAADVDVRWRREWFAIGTGTILLLVVLLLLPAGEGLRVLPEDIAGRARPEARVWLALALAVVLALPAILAWLSGRPAWLLTGAGALLGGIAVTLLLGTALPAVFDSATVTPRLRSASSAPRRCGTIARESS